MELYQLLVEAELENPHELESRQRAAKGHQIVRKLIAALSPHAKKEGARS